MADRLYSARLKFDSAVEHLKTLKDQVGIFMSTDPYSIAEDAKVEGYWYVARLKVREEPPISFSVLAGEVIDGLNAALDHLVYGLSRTKPKGTGFPIFIDPRPYVGVKKDGQRESLLAGVANANRAVIDAYQPYEGELKADPLWLMREFANTDKHRITRPAFARPRNVRFHHPRGCDVTLQRKQSKRPLHDGAVLLRFHVECLRLPPEDKVQVRTEVDLSIGFGDAAVDLVEIDAMVERVHDIIGCFSPAWPNHLERPSG
jgi:hypothetical protein